MEMNLKDIQALIKFAKAEGLPLLKLNGLEVHIPPKDPQGTELGKIKQEIETLKSVTNKLVMLMEVTAKSANPFKPFSNRVEGKVNG